MRRREGNPRIRITAGGRRTAGGWVGATGLSRRGYAIKRTRDVTDDNFGTSGSDVLIVNSMNPGAYVFCELDVIIGNSSQTAAPTTWRAR
jgi:hypothetical protein